MREIKFRGKIKDNNEWIYGYFYEKAQPLQCIKSENDESEKRKCFIIFPGFADWNMPRPMYQVEVLHDTVGQYTGLKDKNGKEIYEGDIYHMGDKNIKYVVTWHDTGLIGKQLGSSSYAGLTHWRNKIEIIGNIYDNPELLEREGKQ